MKGVLNALTLITLTFKGFFHRKLYLVADDYKIYYSGPYDTYFYDFFNHGCFVCRVLRDNISDISRQYVSIDY